MKNLIKKILKEETEIKYNYFKILDEDGDVVGVGATEKGTRNELKYIEHLFNHGYTPVKITKKEYDDYDEGDEIKNF